MFTREITFVTSFAFLCTSPSETGGEFFPFIVDPFSEGYFKVVYLDIRNDITKTRLFKCTENFTTKKLKIFR